jgi:phage baseplate assembly protein gpV
MRRKDARREEQHRVCLVQAQHFWVARRAGRDDLQRAPAVHELGVLLLHDLELDFGGVLEGLEAL